MRQPGSFVIVLEYVHVAVSGQDGLSDTLAFEFAPAVVGYCTALYVRRASPAAT